MLVGSTLYYPVFVPGALFSCGDGHAAQGDGEVAGTAIETAMHCTMRLTVMKKGAAGNHGGSLPRYITPDPRGIYKAVRKCPAAAFGPWDWLFLVAVAQGPQFATTGVDSDIVRAPPTRSIIELMVGCVYIMCLHYLLTTTIQKVQAAATALREMILWLCAEQGFTPYEAMVRRRPHDQWAIVIGYM
jgi:acetamidase/formamidase